MLNLRILTIILAAGTINLYSQIGCQHYKQQFSQTPPYYSAENLRSDTFDVFKYWINLEIGNTLDKNIRGYTTVKFAPKQNNRNFIFFDLLKMQIDSIKEGNTTLSYAYNDTLLKINFAGAKNINDTSFISIHYKGMPQTDASGWGGFYFDNTGSAQYAYNLGVGFAAKPHNFGRVWFPCFDNFKERSRYQFAITCDTARTSYCNGYLLSDIVTGPKRTRTWVMNSEIPTYLASVAVANYEQVSWTANLINGPTPIILASTAADTNSVKSSFINLISCLNGFENFYGPHAWNRVGYCMVPFNSGAMEHATNIAYPRAVLGSLAYEAELMAHEIAHHWWGDLITCETQEDMWINEGLASYSAHLFNEWQYGKALYNSGIKSQHDFLLKQLHHKEGGFRAISGIPHNYTYGDHVYKKGSDVAHTLRNYLGDTLFFNAIKYVMQQKSNNTINSIELRDLMQTSSGKNLNDFFNNWVFNGGWPHFSIDSVRILNQAAGNSTVSVSIKQKLYGAPALYNNVPLEISFFKTDWSRNIEKINYSGAAQTFTFALPFVPATTILNYDGKIGDATSTDVRTLKTISNMNLDYSRTRLMIQNVGSDSTFIHISHNFVKPDAFKNNPQGALISNQHYWKVGGIFSPGFLTKARFNYNGNKAAGNIYGYLDTLLARVNGDSIRVYYRKDAADDWKMVKNAFKFVTGVKTGFIDIDTLKIGEYTLANFGDTNAVIGIKEKVIDDLNLIKVFPNPTKAIVNVDLSKFNTDYNQLVLMSNEGKVIKTISTTDKLVKINMEGIARGVYFIEIRNNRKTLGSKKVILE